MEEKQKNWADGFVFKVQPAAPAYVMGKLHVKVEEAIETLKKHQKDGWVTIDIKQGRSGKFYCEIDNYIKSSSVKHDNYNEAKADKAKPTKMSRENFTPEEDDLPF